SSFDAVDLTIQGPSARAALFVQAKSRLSSARVAGEMPARWL
ncbi:MAG: hypothetical protein JWP50_2370, partial [Phenylobacterium sp.]|nr:hypothetical protein [Phenylobacterium sp.]